VFLGRYGFEGKAGPPRQVFAAGWKADGSMQQAPGMHSPRLPSCLRNLGGVEAWSQSSPAAQVLPTPRPVTPTGQPRRRLLIPRTVGGLAGTPYHVRRSFRGSSGFRAAIWPRRGNALNRENLKRSLRQLFSPGCLKPLPWRESAKRACDAHLSRTPRIFIGTVTVAGPKAQRSIRNWSAPAN